MLSSNYLSFCRIILFLQLFSPSYFCDSNPVEDKGLCRVTNLEGPQKNKPCVLPFKYQETVYEECWCILPFNQTHEKECKKNMIQMGSFGAQPG